MAIDTQPVLANSFAGGASGSTIPAGPGSGGPTYASLGTADGMLFDTVTISSGQAMTYDNTLVSGLTMCKIVAANTSTCFGMWAASGMLANPAAQQWFRSFEFLPSLPVSAQPLVWMGIGSTRAGDVVVNSNGTLSVRDAAGTVQLTTTTTVTAGQLFRIEGYITSSATVGQIELKLFTSPWSATAAETKTSAASLNTTGGAMTQVRYGGATACASGVTLGQWGCAVSTTGYVGAGAVVQQMVCGAPTSSGFTVISKPTGGTSLRLKVATNSGLTANVTFVSAQAPDAYGYVRHTVTGLNPYTRYWCQLLDTPPGQSEMAVGSVGTCKTLAAAGSIQSFTLAVASCVNTADELPNPDIALNDWIAWGADLNVFTGDFGYSNPTFTDQPSQIGTWELQTWFYGMEPITRTGWGFYCRSNHDSTNTAGGVNDDSNNTWTAANILAAQEVFPQGPLGDQVNSPVHSLCQSWVTGRVRFILLDIRNVDRSPGANTDNSSKTMLGATQLAWLYGQLTQPEPLKIIITDTQWLGTSVPSLGADPELGKWWSYQTERAAIVSQMIAGWSRMRNVLLIHGDFHGVAVATAAQSAANAGGQMPVYCAAPMRQTGAATINPGTFTAYYNNSGGECRFYGRVTVTDNGSNITVQYQGWDATNSVAQVTQTDVFQVNAGTLPARGLMGL
jgi:phosphodiesterase/alkaline phosphatase D-like protein